MGTVSCLSWAFTGSVASMLDRGVAVRDGVRKLTLESSVRAGGSSATSKSREFGLVWIGLWDVKLPS